MTDNEKLNVNDNLTKSTNEIKNTSENNNVINKDDMFKGLNTYYVPEIKKKDKTKIVHMDKKDTIFMILFFVISFLIVNFAIFYNFNLGFTISFFALFIVTTAYFFKKDFKASAFTYICGVLSLFGAVVPTLFYGVTTKMIAISVSGLLFTVYTCGISGTFNSKEGSYKSLIDMIFGIIISPFMNFVNVVKSFKFSLTKNKKIVDVLIGVVVALPLLFIIVPLLVSSDAAFEGLVEIVFNNIWVYILKFVISTVIAIYLISYFYSKKAHYKIGSENIAKSNQKLRFVPYSVSISFLSVISVTYIVYLFSQLAYFFSAFSGILPAGYEFSASVYARRGFYEMFIICLINIALVTVVNMFTKRVDKNKIPPVLKGLQCFVLMFSILLLVIAMSKMKLNIEHFGLSKPRLFVSLVEIMLFVIIAFCLVHVFFPKVNYMQPIIVICSLMFILFVGVDVDANIAKYNVEMYQKGKLETVDVTYLNSLSDTALPYIMELTEDKNEDIAVHAKSTIRDTYYYQYSDCLEINDNHEMVVKYNPDFRLYNYGKERCYKYMAEYYNSLSNEEKGRFLNREQSYFAPEDYFYYGDEFGDNQSAYVQNIQ